MLGGLTFEKFLDVYSLGLGFLEVASRCSAWGLPQDLERISDSPNMSNVDKVCSSPPFTPIQKDDYIFT